MSRDRFLVRNDWNQFTSAIKGTIKFLLDYPAFTNLGIM